MLFAPEVERLSFLKNDRALLAYYLGKQFESDKPFGNVARSHLDVAVSMWLVGLQGDAAPLVSRSVEWLRLAIQADENFGLNHNFHRMTLHSAKALGDWMENNWNAEDLWEHARAFEEAAWRDEKQPWPQNTVIKNGLDDYMAFAYQAGEHDETYEAGIQMYERWAGEKPLSLSKVLKPREYGYALCLHEARQQFDRDELFAAGRRMLRANLESNWLGAGQFIRAATWLKIVYWHRDPALTALETILKAYDDMPSVKRPDFI